MKPFSKQTHKWLLSTLLVAALGSQYYFSVSSLSLGSFDMSSNATAEEQLKADIAKLEATEGVMGANGKLDPKAEKIKQELIAKAKPKIDAEKAAAASATKPASGKIVLEPVKKTDAKPTAAPAKADAKPVEAKPASADASVATSKTEAETLKIHCDTCGASGISVSGSTDSLASLTKLLLSKETQTAAAKVEPKEKDHGAETAAERREREKEEREEKKELARQKKEDIKQAKEDKLRTAKEDRNEAFADKAEEIADKCQDDLGCKVTRFSSLLRTYSGKKKVDQFAVTKAFNQYLDKDLKAGLRGEDGSEGKMAALEAIDSLMANVPSDYKSLKVRTVDTAKSAQTAQAAAVNGLYKQADVYTKQNRLNEALTTRDQAMKAETVFKQDANTIYQSMYEGLNSAKDQTTLEYITNNYVPEIRNLMTRLSSSTGLTDTNVVSTGNRGARGGNSTVVNGTIQNSNNSLSNVQFGTVAPNRTNNRTGVNFK